MRSKFLASTLAIGLGLAAPVVSAIGFPDVVIAQTVEEKKKEADSLMKKGWKLFQSDQFDAAFQDWKQALKFYQESKDRRGEGYALGGLGLYYQALKNYLEAVKYYEQFLEVSRELKDRSAEGATLGNLGDVYGDLGNYSKAIEYQEQSLAIARELKDRSAEAPVLSSLGNTYSLIGNYSKAIDYYEQHLLISRKLKDRLEEGSALINLGSLYHELGDYSKAVEYQEKGLSTIRELKNIFREETALRNLGITYRSLGNYSKAIVYLEQSLAIARKLKNRSGEGITLGGLGTVYQLLNKYPQAIEYQEQSLAISRELKERRVEGKALGNLGNTYYSLGNYSKAISYHEESLEIDRETQDQRGEGSSLGNLGTVYQTLGNYPKAIEYQEKQLAISRKIKDRSGEGTALGNLGAVYKALGNYPKAIEYQETSLAIKREIKNRKGEGASLGNLGLIYASLKNYTKATEYYSQTLAIAREIKDRDSEYAVLTNVAVTLKKQNQFNLAIVFYKQSVNVAESIRADLRQLSREAQERYTSTVANTYRNLSDLLLTQGRTREAQAILDLLKVQESSNYDEQQQTSIQFLLHPLEIQTWKHIEQQQFSIKTLELLGNRLKQNRDRITQDMNNQSIAIGNPNKLLNAKPNSLLIQNLVVGDKLWVIWTNAKGETKTIVQAIPQKELTETVDRLRQALSTSSSDLNQLKATSQQLYNWLIPPALQTELAQNPNLHLFFSLDHVTRYIPIAALYDGKQYLIQKHTLSNLITTETDMSDRFSPADRPANILALGTSNAVGGFNALPNVESELYAIVKTQNSDKGIYPGTIQLNEAFTANSLRTTNSHRVLHIATHGSFNPKTINASYLLLGNGDKLPITEIANLTTLSDKHLVVLSACETGLSGNSPDGTEISGISSYFLRRGAKSVLASLWLVNDPATALLMKNFYTQLSQPNTSKAIALQTVQKQFLDRTLTDKDAKAIVRGASGSPNRGVRRYREGQPPPNSFEHPYYWAPFILVGNSL